MIDKLNSLFQLIKSVLVSLRDTDLSQVSYGSLGLALGAGLFIFSVFLYKILRGRNKFRHFYSGHMIPAEYHRSRLARLFSILPIVFLAGSVLFLLIAIANPYLPRTKIESIVESRERVDMIDVSSSRGWPLRNTGKPSGEIGRKAYLKFLETRRGQNDRVSLWVFASYAYKVEDFLIDDDLILMQAEDAPYVITNRIHPSFPWNDESGSYMDFVNAEEMVKTGRIKLIDNEGGTNLVNGLRAVIKYFDQEGKKNIKRKSLVIETDAAIEADPEAEFKELRKRGITPYAIFIAPNVQGEAQFGTRDPLAISKDLKEKIKRYGGTVFDAEDAKSLDRAYTEINKFETAPVNIIRHLLRIIIFQRPLMVAIILAMFSTLLGSLFGREYP